MAIRNLCTDHSEGHNNFKAWFNAKVSGGLKDNDAVDNMDMLAKLCQLLSNWNLNGRYDNYLASPTPS